MKKIIIPVLSLLMIFSLVSCGGKKQSASSIAQKWCELNGKAFKAEGEAKAAAEAARDAYEKEMEEKYGKDKEFMAEIGKEVEKCEDASEGR